MWDALCSHILECWIETGMGREGLLTLLPRKPNLLEEKEMCERVLLFLLSLPDSENHQGIKIPETQREAHAEAEHWDSDLPLSPAKLCCCSTLSCPGAIQRWTEGHWKPLRPIYQETQTALSRAESRRNALLQWSLGPHNWLRRWKHKSQYFSIKDGINYVLVSSGSDETTLW